LARLQVARGECPGIHAILVQACSAASNASGIARPAQVFRCAPPSAGSCWQRFAADLRWSQDPPRCGDV